MLLTATMIATEDNKEAYKRRIAAYYIQGILGPTPEQAAAIVDAIAQGDVPGVAIKF